MDITELILSDHHEQRRMFAFLDDLHGDTTALTAVWDRLQILLEVHAAAEEKLFYPRLLELGTGAGSKNSADAETRDAIHDHNDIRDAIKEVSKQSVGSTSWWKAVAKAREANSDHMGEEERESLADFRRHADLQQRHDIAVAFAAFEAKHAAGIDATDKDPEIYIADHR